ncbi:MAG: right-handed parallel beta-helix repeat-containing protein [Verrucomicrobia bacterium]|nr:right-handed parallel beta-helix repeat-containing protein [Verrucomicrobiota bacterium]
MKKLTETRPNLSFAVLILGLASASFATAADLHVPADHPTIQAAVDAAQTSDTIRIASGVYTNQVQIISKKLTLIGQPGTILRATEQLASLPVWRGHVPIMAIHSSEVTVRGLTFEGERLAGHFVGPGVGNLVGIYFRESSGTVENCAFYGFRESTPGPKGTDPLVFVRVAVDATEVEFRVVGSTFADNYGGIFCLGSATPQTVNVTVENNTIVCLGPLANDDNYSGIFIREGVGGRIAGNTISGYSYVGTKAAFPIGFGILAANEANSPAFGILQHLEIEGNTLRDNQVHIALIKGDGSVVRNNRFQGTAPGIIPTGLGVTGNGVVIANNQFEKMNEGIRLMGNDPMFGTLLGIAVNAQVTGNRFCEVTTPVTVQPLASATPEGTLLCPFPAPVLDIASAVLVSWPEVEAGYMVETAPAPDGPWSPSDATLFLHDGRSSIAVPTAGANRYFRLRKL